MKNLIKKILRYLLFGVYVIVVAAVLVVTAVVLVLVYVPVITLVEFVKAFYEVWLLIKNGYKTAFEDAHLLL